MFFLLTNKQKYNFVNSIIDNYKSVYNAVGRKMTVKTELDYRVRLYKLLKIKRKNGLEW